MLNTLNKGTSEKTAESIPNNSDVSPISTKTLHWYHWLVVFLSLILTLTAWYITNKQARQKSQILFEYQVAQILSQVKERMVKYEDALGAGVATIHSHDRNINSEIWRKFSKTLDIDEKYQGINGIGVIYSIKENEKPSFLYKQRQSRPDFVIHPKHSEKELWPIVYIEPVESNRKAVGLDMAHEANRFDAAKKARDSGLSQITGPITLVQDAKKTPGFLFYKPFYKYIQAPIDENHRQAEFAGLVYAPFIMNRLMEGTLQNKNRMVIFSVIDDGFLLYNELTEQSVDYDKTPLFTTVIDESMFGRNWKFEIHSTQLFRHQQQNHRSLIILVGGLVIDSMLLALFILLSNSNAKAFAIANKMTQGLRSSELNLNATFENLMDGLITLDKRGVILRFNHAAEEMFDFKAHEVIGKHFTALPYPNKAKHFLNIVDAQSIKKRFKTFALKSDGTEFPIDIMSNEYNIKGEPHFISIIRDLSKTVLTNKLIAEKEALLDTSIQALSSGFAITNVAGQFIEVNNALCHWLNYSKEDFYKMRIHSIVGDDELREIQSIMESIFRGSYKQDQREFQFRTSNGSLLWGLLSTSPVKDELDNISYIVLHIVDIQKEKELNMNLVDKNASLEKSNADLERFAYIASHDLKSPLNAICQLTTWIEEDSDKTLSQGSREHLALLKGRATRMRQLLDDLLSYSKVSRYNYLAEVFNLLDIVNDQKSLVNCPETFTINVPSVQLILPKIPFELVIRNLISNSIKHHDKNSGNVDITIQTLHGCYILKVEDDGPGIPKNMESKVFEMFQTLRSRDEVEGSGMGLAMVKRIVEHYKGNVRIVASPHHGASIEIQWPKSDIE